MLGKSPDIANFSLQLQKTPPGGLGGLLCPWFNLTWVVVGWSRIILPAAGLRDAKAGVRRGDLGLSLHVTGARCRGN